MFENYNVTMFNRKGKLYLQYYINGKQKQKSTRLPDTPQNRKLVKNEVIPKLILKLKSGDFNKPKVEVFKWYGDKYLRTKENLKTFWDLKNVLYNQLYPNFGDITIDKIKRGDIKLWIDELLNRITPQRAKTLLNIMGTVFDVAIEYEHIKDNPTKNITLPKNVIVREMKPFSPQEVESLISNAEGWFKNFITFCFYTGMRHGEIIALNWSDIDFENLIINVNKRVKHGQTDTPKTKSGIRKIPIFKPLLPFLKNQLQISKQSKSLKVFTNPNTQKAFYDTKHLTPHWKRVLAKCGFEYRVIYNTRHTFASNMIKSGVNMLDLAQMMGHSNTEEIIRTYAKYLPNEHLKISRDFNPFTDKLTDNMEKNTINKMFY